MRRREFITLLGGAAASWPLATRAQQLDRMRLIGVLMHLAADDLEGQARLKAFLLGLQQLGWTDSRNVRIEIRWGANDADRQRYAQELVALAPDVILASTTLATVALQNATRTLPIVFCNVADPVGGGLVESLARPGGNATGFMQFEYAMSAKWLELLKDITPGLMRVAVIRDSANPASIGQFAVIQSLAPTFGLEFTPIVARNADEIERAVTAFARSSNSGLIVVGSALGASTSKLIVTLAAGHRLPTVYPFRYFVTDGGLISYGPDSIDPYRQAAGYVDRILKGERPADLPVQAAAKFELVINLKAAKGLGLTVPHSLLSRADELID